MYVSHRRQFSILVKRLFDNQTAKDHCLEEIDKEIVDKIMKEL
jgi:hypothetical protein